MFRNLRLRRGIERTMHRRASWLTSHSTTIPPPQLAQQPVVGKDLLLIEASLSHSDTNTQLDSSGQVISPTQRPSPDDTQNVHIIPIYFSPYLDATCFRWSPSSCSSQPNSLKLTSFIVVSFTIFGCELHEDGDQPKHVAAR